MKIENKNKQYLHNRNYQSNTLPIKFVMCNRLLRSPAFYDVLIRDITFATETDINIPQTTINPIFILLLSSKIYRNNNITTAKMTRLSHVGNPSVYEAGDQRGARTESEQLHHGKISTT